MIKFVLLAFLVGAAVARPETANKEFLERQKAVLQLLEKVQIPFYYKEFEEIAQTYQPLQHLDKYERTGAVKYIVKAHEKHELKPKYQIFSIYHPEDRHQAIKFFEALYYAKDFQTFYKTAVYTRYVANEQMFVYALTTAVLHREDTRGVRLPPQYEIFPEHFINSRAIYQAYKQKGLNKEPVTVEVKNKWYSQKNWETLLQYYTDDLGLTTHNHLFHKSFPTWYEYVNGKELHRQGEFYFYAQHQLVNRYNLERLSHNIPTVRAVEWETRKVEYGFNPQTIYRNGEEFPVRYDDMEIQDVHDKKYGKVLVRDVRDYERRIRSAIDKQFVLKGEYQVQSLNNTEGVNVLGQIIYGAHNNEEAHHYYGNLNVYSHALLGRIVDPEGKYNLAPSVIEQDVAVRDPLYYQLKKNYDELFQQHKYHLRPYTKEQIEMQGVTVEDVQVTELKTFLEPYEITLNNIFDTTYQGEQQEKEVVKAKVERLNHKPYQYTIQVQSQQEFDAVVRIYLAPKYNSFGQKYTPQEQSWKAVELDTFVTKVNTGRNTIVRRSSESTVTHKDYYGITELKQKVNEALQGQGEFEINKNYRHCGFPAHLLLPRGKVGGQEYQLIVYVSNYNEEKVTDAQPIYEKGASSICGVMKGKYPLAKPLGYPLDRAIPNVHVFETTKNFFVKDVLIHHQEQHQQFHEVDVEGDNKVHVVHF
uniref:Hexamerin 1 n=1 Tax=Lepidocampa weberi TaxID=165470 RepID=A0A067XNY3_9HEXA|nr:hexamerin 1 precursor [Lepidocampa weberi]